MRFSPNEGQAIKLRKLEEVTKCNLGQCIQLLELTNWDLQKAIQLNTTIQETKKATVPVVFDPNMILVVYVEMGKELKHSGMHQLEIELNKKTYTTGWVESLGRPSFRSTFEFKHIGKGRFLRMALWHRRTFTPNKKVAEVRFDLAKIHDSNKKGLSKFSGWVPMPYKDRIGAHLYVNMELRTLNGNKEEIVREKNEKKKHLKVNVDASEVKPLNNSSDSDSFIETDGVDKLTTHQHPVENDFVEFKESTSDGTLSTLDNWGIPATSLNDKKAITIFYFVCVIILPMILDLKCIFKPHNFFINIFHHHQKSVSQGSQESDQALKQQDQPIKSNLSKKLGREKKLSKKKKSTKSAFGSSEVFIASLKVGEDPFAEFNDVKFTDIEMQNLKDETPDKFLKEIDTPQINSPLNPTSEESQGSPSITPLTSRTETSDNGLVETNFQNIESSEAIVDALLDKFYSEVPDKSCLEVPGKSSSTSSSPVFPEELVEKNVSPKASLSAKASISPKASISSKPSISPKSPVSSNAKPKSNTKPKKLEQKKKDSPSESSQVSMFPDAAEISGLVSSPTYDN
eukprot:GHVP01062471.1.p1 GENE.GHVP01062471.1~~GHVP01062471.1.p1  ORF type:complete len:571 (+),score=124.87 GHVP01062471.1:1589-3301(+)